MALANAMLDANRITARSIGSTKAGALPVRESDGHKGQKYRQREGPKPHPDLGAPIHSSLRSDVRELAHQSEDAENSADENQDWHLKARDKPTTANGRWCCVILKS
jgi:hypothetical protein